MRRCLAGTLAAAVACTLAACGGQDAPAASTSSSVSSGGTLTVLAAASLTESFDTLGASFEQAHPGTKVRFSYGGSGALATQVSQGVPADVFASAATDPMDRLTKSGAALDPQVFATNVLTIVVPPANPRGVVGVADLARPGVSVALCRVDMPCGAAAKTVLAANGVSVKPVTEEADVKSTLAKVSLGEVDAGLVYTTDAKAAGEKVRAVPLAHADAGRTTYPIAVLRDSRNQELAKAFVAHVRSEAGRHVIADAGFTLP